jgi:hypothetical protein
VQALLGRNEQALAILQQVYLERVELTSWWYYLEMEPAYAPLRRDPRYIGDSL